MEYLLGSLITLVTIYCVARVFQQKEEPINNTIRYSQSHVYNLIAPLMPTNKEIKATMPLISQSKKHFDSTYVNVVVFEGKAYWIRDNEFFTADADGATVLKETATKVDTMTMDKVELDKIAFIVDLLTKGERQ